MPIKMSTRKFNSIVKKYTEQYIKPKEIEIVDINSLKDKQNYTDVSVKENGTISHVKVIETDNKVVCGVVSQKKETKVSNTDFMAKTYGSCIELDNGTIKVKLVNEDNSKYQCFIL